ncbi:MAG: hypothetical protein AAF708_14955 [Deinococcota bacterium]
MKKNVNRPYTFVPLVLIILAFSALLTWLQTPSRDVTPSATTDGATTDTANTLTASQVDMTKLIAPSEIMLANFHGPLRVYEPNPIWFTDDQGDAIYLTGSHTWHVMRDIGPSNPPPEMDYDAFLDMMADNNHNFLRFWVWDMLQGVDKNVYGSDPSWVAPMPWQRVSADTSVEPAVDGNPPFDLTKLDDAYFVRLRERVIAAGERGIYVGIMLFEGFGGLFHDDGSHPFQAANNINGIDVGRARGAYNDIALNDSEVWALQLAYVNRVIDTVNDLDNVMYEISNETHNESVNWQYALIHHINDYQASKPKQHLVGITFMPGDSYSSADTNNNLLYDSPADWVSPRQRDGEDWRNNVPPAGNTGGKIVLLDTDHLGPMWDLPSWTWRTFIRGHHPILMDPWNTLDTLQDDVPMESLNLLRLSMGQTRRYAARLELGTLSPQPQLASSRYALASDREYLVFARGGDNITVNLENTPGQLNYEWFDWQADEVVSTGQVEGGSSVTIDKPISGSAIIYLWAVNE